VSQLFDSKDAAEKVVLTFDFSAAATTDAGALQSGETLTGTPTVTVSVADGADASPSSVLNGAGAVSSGPITTDSGAIIPTGQAFLQPVQAGVAGVNYSIKVVATTTNSQKTLARVGVLPVVSA